MSTRCEKNLHLLHIQDFVYRDKLGQERNLQDLQNYSRQLVIRFILSDAGGTISSRHFEVIL